MFLTEDELQDLTGYKMPARQARWLDRAGIGYALDRWRRPKVLRAEVERALSSSPETYEGPRLDVLRG